MMKGGRVTKLLSVLLLALPMSLALSACGGSGSPSSVSDPRGQGNPKTGVLTKAEYIAKADALCEKEAPRAKARLRRGEERVEDSEGGTRTEEEVGASVLHEEAAADLVELGPLKRLEPPHADAAVIGSIVRHGERLAMRSDEIATVLAKGETRVAEAMFEELEKEGLLTERLEQSFGFKVCGQMEAGPMPGAGTTATPG
jgi:hypothetical protein